MAKDEPKHKSAGWRDLGGEQPAATPGRHGWQQGQLAGTGETRQPWSKRTKLAILGTLLALVAVGIYTVIIYFIPPKPAAMLLVGSGYETNLLLPPNALGWNGLKKISEWANSSEPDSARGGSWWGIFDVPTRMRLVGRNQLSHPTTWQRIWNDCPRDFKEKTLVIYLSLHGGADEKGAYLLADDEHGLVKVYCAGIFDDLQDERLKDKHIVLVLDSPHVETHWPIGMYRNDFVARLKEQFENYKFNNDVHVLCACGANEHSWASEDLQNTVFAHFFLKCLRGESNPSGERRITLQGLFDYLENKVSAWVKSNRDVEQHPILLQGKSSPNQVELARITEPDSQLAADTRGPIKLAELEKGWEDWEKLQTSVPAPWTFAPHLWRRYQEAMLRWEYLVRLGDPTGKAVNLQGHAEALKRTIQDLQEIKEAEPCLGYSIPLARALGHPDADASELRQAEALYSKLKLPSQNKLTAAELKVRQTLVGHQLMEEVIKRSPKLDEFKKAAQWWENVEKQLKQPRSAEMHYFMMLNRDAVDHVPPKLLALAVNVRCLAEMAMLGDDSPTGVYPYSEVIYPWIKTELDQADRDRREGEDWLFGSEADHWTNAGKKLEAAHGQFDKLLKDAAFLRNALATRDRVWAELPALAQWLADQPDKTNEHQVVQALADNLGKLTTDLRKPGGIAPQRLSVLAHEIDKQHKNMLQVYFNHCETLKDTVHHQRYHSIQTALSVPLLVGGKRKPLVIDIDSISKKLLSGDVPLPRSGGQNEAAKRPFELHQELGQAVYQSCLETKGAQVGSALVALPQRIQAGLDESLKSAKLTEADQKLLVPVDLCRLLPGGLAGIIEEKATPSAPPQELRLLRVYQLLLAQADRTFQDHWFADPNDSQRELTYYIPAGKKYVDSARTLKINKPAEEDQNLYGKRLAALTALEKNFLKPAGLTAEPLSKRTWTEQQERRLEWSLQADLGVPAGIPMIWYPLVGDEKPQRIAIVDWQPDKETKEIYRAAKYVKDKDWPDKASKLGIRFGGVYRGQRLDYPDFVLEKLKPDVIVQHFQPPVGQAGLAVRMDKDFTYGAVSIVLDTSGSMVQNKVPGQKNKTRFDLALDALERVLNALPDGTYVSILRFDSEKEDRETGIKFVKTNDGRPDVDKLTPFRRLALLNQLKLSRFYNNSPIAKAIGKSVAEGFPAPFEGPKVTLVLTDGDDNESIPRNIIDPDTQPKAYALAVNKKLGQLNDTNPQVQVFVVVSFIPEDDDEAKRAKAQFEVVKNFGNFIIEPNGAKLGKTIEDLLRPRLKLIPELVLEAPGLKPLLVNRPDGELQWSLVPPGIYATKVQGQTTNNVVLAGGQNMLLELRETNDNKAVLKRGIIGKQKESARLEPKEKDNWLATLIENTPDRSLKQVLVLEKWEGLKDRGAEIQQVTPEMVWLEVEPATKKKPSLLNWHNDWNFAAPAFRLQADGWPIINGNPDAPQLKAWWLEAPNQVTDLIQKDGGRKERMTPEQGPVRFPKIGATKDVVVTLTVEEREIEEAPKKPVKRPCLVFRVHHPLNQRVWIRWKPAGQPPGEEHRYYSDIDASQYTAMFYPYKNNPGPEDFEILCLTSFKAAVGPVSFTRDVPVVAPRIFKNPLDY